MNQWAPVLERHLEELVRLNERLLRLVEARQQAMTSRDMPRLESLMTQERTVSMAVYEEERKRQTTVSRLMAGMGKSEDEASAVSLAEVAEWLGEPHKTRLLGLRATLHGVARRVEEANSTAMGLAQRFLPYFQELLGILVDGTVGQASYTAAGHATRSGSGGMNVLDVRV